MPESNIKIPQSASPVARTGGGDISELELSRERYTLQTTPLTRAQPVHPKQLLSAPVNKFTARLNRGPTNVKLLRNCLDEYKTPVSTPVKLPKKIGPKAISMEDLTPTKRIRKERRLEDVQSPLSPELCRSTEEVEAAGRVCRFMMLAAWRRRRAEVTCLKKTLQFQVTCSEKLRIQVATLKSLLDSDNAKVRMAMKELDRLKQLLKEKDLEKAVLEREKNALEADVCAAEDRASEMSIGWHNCRNELEGTRAAAAVCEHALSLERAAAGEARQQRDHAYTRLSLIEEELSQHESLLAAAEAEVSTLNHELDQKDKLLARVEDDLKMEKQAREDCVRECASLSARVCAATKDTGALKAVVDELRAELVRLDLELRLTREQLNWWPRPLTKLMGAARSLLRYPISLPEAVMWSLLPARHGC